MSATDHEPQDDGDAETDLPPPPDTLTVPLPLDEPSPGLAADFVADVAQLYLNEIGQHPLLTAD
ncbi:MAG: RNA polymerase sigma factor RpoS, partial [Burkholderiales bacterium]|nr:RNA polymerase sigma factor RpoS [Burkholderiales bacterium]